MREIELVLPEFKAKQKLIWNSPATEILIAGDTRAGKSFFIRKAYILLCCEIAGLVTDILRLNYEDVINNYMVGETSFPILLRPLEREGLVRINESEIIFWNDSVISLGHCADDKVARKHQGNAVHVRTLDESAQLPEGRIRGLSGWLTLSKDMEDRIPPKWKGLFPRFYHLTNFIGPGMGYYRRGFLEPREPFQIEEVGQFRRQYIPMYLTDNDSEDAQKTIARIKEAFPDPAVQKALLECDWRQAVGEFFPEWDETRHVVTDFVPPSHWFRFRGFDWGTADPFCVLWCAVSDGEPFKDEDGNERWFPRGSFVIYDEWYGCDEAHPQIGLRLRNEDIAYGILERSEYFAKKVPTLTDSLPFQDRGGETIAQTFYKCGVTLTKGDTSRVPGWSQVRSRLIGIELDSNDHRKCPMLFVAEKCKYLRNYMPMLTRHKSEKKSEDAIETGESTHATDTLRLICMAHSVIKDKVEPLQSRIERELKARKPTVQNLVKQVVPGARYFG